MKLGSVCHIVMHQHSTTLAGHAWQKLTPSDALVPSLPVACFPFSVGVGANCSTCSQGCPFTSACTGGICSALFLIFADSCTCCRCSVRPPRPTSMLAHSWLLRRCPFARRTHGSVLPATRLQCNGLPGASSNTAQLHLGFLTARRTSMTAGPLCTPGSLPVGGFCLGCGPGACMPGTTCGGGSNFGSCGACSRQCSTAMPRLSQQSHHVHT